MERESNLYPSRACLQSSECRSTLAFQTLIIADDMSGCLTLRNEHFGYRYPTKDDVQYSERVLMTKFQERLSLLLLPAEDTMGEKG